MVEPKSWNPNIVVLGPKQAHYQNVISKHKCQSHLHLFLAKIFLFLVKSDFWPRSLKHGSINYMIMDIKKKNSLLIKKKVFYKFFLFFFLI